MLEGLARDVIRVVQNARKDADLVPDDRIVLGLGVDGDLRVAVETHTDLIAAEVLAVNLGFEPDSEALHTETVDIQGDSMELSIAKT